MTHTSAAMAKHIVNQKCGQITPCGTWTSPCADQTSCNSENPGTCQAAPAPAPTTPASGPTPPACPENDAPGYHCQLSWCSMAHLVPNCPKTCCNSESNSAATTLIQLCEAKSALSALEGDCAATGLGDGVADTEGEYEVFAGGTPDGEMFTPYDQGFRKCTGSSTWTVKTCKADAQGNKCGCTDGLVKFTTSSSLDPMPLHQSQADQAWCQQLFQTYNRNAMETGRLSFKTAQTEMFSDCPASCPPTPAPTTPPTTLAACPEIDDQGRTDCQSSWCASAYWASMCPKTCCNSELNSVE